MKCSNIHIANVANMTKYSNLESNNRPERFHEKKLFDFSEIMDHKESRHLITISFQQYYGLELGNSERNEPRSRLEIQATEPENKFGIVINCESCQYWFL